ncbi:MAG: MCP four helix bundle domain-containing protein [Magnetococcales bacterium]|nr:MCP four helix bundle domain-containing protein [Magnetococcales bacterium]
MKMLPLKIRLRTSSGLLVLLIVALGAFAIFNLNELSSLTNRLYRHPFTVSTAVLRIEANASEMRSALKDIMLTDKSEKVSELHQRINALEQLIQDDFKIINQRFLGDKAMVAKAEKRFANWKAPRDAVIEKAMRGDTSALRNHLADNTEAKNIRKIASSMEELHDFASNKAVEFHRRALSDRDNALKITYLFVGVCVLLGFWSSRAIVTALREVINAVSTSAAEMATTISQQERISSQQTTSVNETNTTMEELGASSQQSSEQAASAAANAQQALELTGDGREQMTQMVRSMENTQQRMDAIANQILILSEQTSQIGNITNTVTDFANETKMLAMNAAVEAVRAGEHGKGFSVLSVEIRKLAEESKRSAERINHLVEEIQKATNTTVMVTEEGSKTVREGMRMVHRTEEIFQDVNGAITSSSESAQQIAMNINQQAIAIKQVVDAMRDLRTGAKETNSGMKQVKIGIQTLNISAGTLKEMT